MENNTEPYSFDLNLDFLDSETQNTKNANLVPEYPEQSQIHSTYDIEALASRIANVNDIVIQLKATKEDNFKLQKQMQELSESAMSIQSMYDQEKSEKLKLMKLNRELQEKYEKVEAQLTNKTLHFEQIQSQMELEAEDKKPIPYDDLALKYQRMVLQFEEERHLPSKERIFLQLVKEYLESKNLSPLPFFKKKGKSRVKLENRDFAIQCDIKVESKSQETQCSLGPSVEEKTELKTQGTQYISSTTTRGTSTSTFIKTHSVGTIFPEPTPPVSIEDIFKEMICTVSPLSPMTVGSQRELKEEKIETKSVGTCTDIKNVRKPIDYTVANIKRSDSRPPSRDNNWYDRVKNEIPLMGMPPLNPFTGLGIPVTPMHNNVTELWNMLGHTIFALLQQNSAAASPQMNAMHMNVVNDRMRNSSGRNTLPSEQQGNCEPLTRDDYFEQEFPREFSASTRSAATSPTLPSELQAHQLHPKSSFEVTMKTPYQPVDIKKIVLNSNFSDSVVSSSRKLSEVDEILQLFPEYSDSLKKRKAIKRLLKKANKNKKPNISSSIAESIQISSNLNPTSSASSASTSSHSQLQGNWKTEMFGDSSMDNHSQKYIQNHSPDPYPKENWKPIETEQPTNNFEWLKPTRIRSPIEEEFLGFDEKNNLLPTSNVFCKPELPPKRQKIVNPPDSSFSMFQKHSNMSSTKIEPIVESLPTLSPSTTKRKRRTKKVDSKQGRNKINKLDETLIPVNPKAATEAKKSQGSLRIYKAKTNKNKILPIQHTHTTTSAFKPLRSLSLDKLNIVQQEPQNQNAQEPKRVSSFHKPDWMNRTKNSGMEEIHVLQNNHGPMVMKVEKPPDSVFEDIKTCFSNHKQDSKIQDVKTCLITPKLERDIKPSMSTISFNQVPINESVNFAEQSVPFVAKKEDGTYKFLIQNYQSTNNSINSPNILSYCENIPSAAANSSITILNEEWISQSNDFKGTNQENPVINDATQSIDKKEIDIENIPIYFLDDQNMVQDLEHSNEIDLNINQPNRRSTILPGFEAIQQGIQNSSTQFIPSHNEFHNEKLQKNSINIVNTAESVSTIGDVKPLICLVQQSNFCNENTISNREEEDIKILPPHHYLKNENQFGSDGSQLEKDFSTETIRNNENNSLKIIVEAPSSSSNCPASKEDNLKIQTQSNEIIPNFESKINSPNSNQPIIVTQLKRDDVSCSDNSDNDGDLSIDSLSQSPKSTNASLLDLSAILKTPERSEKFNNQFKTPDNDPQNYSLINKVITPFTEKLVEDYLLNESPGKEGPKFQEFLDKILEDVALPLSPISALGSSEKPNDSEADSCDDTFSEAPRKYKRKGSARISAGNCEPKANELSYYGSLSTPNIELGKYTKRKTETQLNKEDKLVRLENEEKINIKMGFFQETLNEEDDEPVCEPIGRYPESDFELINKNYMEETTNFKTEIKEVNKKPICTENVGPCVDLLTKDEESQNLCAKSEQYANNSFEDSSFYDEAPASPPSTEQMPNPTHTLRETFEQTSPSKKDSNSYQKSFISHLIANYNSELHNTSDKGDEFNKIILELQDCINEFLKYEYHPVAALRFVDSVLKVTSKGEIVARAILNIVKEAPRSKADVTGPLADIYPSQTLCKLLVVLRQLCQHYPSLFLDIQTVIEQTMFTFSKEILPLEVLLNLTQFYLAIINNPTAGPNPARLFICKCLYFFNVKSVPMIYHTLCVYPTVLPNKQDPTYDRSDIIISAIQSILMSTYYDPEKTDCMSKQMVAKLRLFYKYENFKPPRDEVIENIMAKIRCGRSKNVSYALAIICKRMEQTQTEKFILNERLIPLANEFYNTFNQTTENDEKIACVLECISFVIKPFDVNTDVSHYFNLFGRYLNAASNRKVVQEAAVAAILRMARFGYVQCFNAVYNYKPTYELSWDLKLMLRSFVYKKGENFLNTLERQAQELLDT